MKLSDSIVQKLDSTLGITGRPRRILYNGQWVATGCMEWSPSPSVPEIWANVSPGLQNALQRSQEVVRQIHTDQPMARINEFFAKEPPHIQAEYEELLSKLHEVSDPFLVHPPKPEYSADLQKALVRIQESMKAEQAHSETHFDIDVYLMRVRELIQKEPPNLQAEWAAVMPTLKALRYLPRRVARQRKATIDKVKNLLRDEPVIAYRAGIEWDGMPSATYETIVVAPTTDQFDILRFEKTDGVNRGLRTEDVIQRLKVLDEHYGIEITGAAISGLEFVFKRIPKGKEARELGKWLFDFCPDLYEAPKSFRGGKVTLWWD